MLQHHHNTLTLVHGRFNALFQAFLVFRFVIHQKTVHHDLNVMGLIPVQFHAFDDVPDLSIDPDLYKSLFGNLFKEFPVVAFPGTDHRGKDIDPLVMKLRNEQFPNLIIGVAHHFLTSVVAIGIASPGVEKPEEIIDLRNGPYGTAGTFTGGFLLYGDDRRKAFYFIYIGTLQAPKKLAGIGRETVNITSTTFSTHG